MKSIYKTTAIIITYTILASICCKFMAVAFYYPVSVFGDVKIVRSPMMNTTEYDHVYLTINDQTFDPRFLGLYKSNNVDYNTISKTYNNPKEFLEYQTIIPLWD